MFYALALLLLFFVTKVMLPVATIKLQPSKWSRFGSLNRLLTSLVLLAACYFLASAVKLPIGTASAVSKVISVAHAIERHKS